MSKLQRWYDSENRLNILRRTAKEVRSYAVQRKVLTTALACLTLLTTLLYMCAALYKNSGSFSVSVNKVEMTKYGLSLSETKDMAYATSHLNAKINEHMTNIAEREIPPNVDMVDGEHNGENYIAYTFYLKNVGEGDLSYEYELAISDITNQLDEAIRVRLYVNGVPTTYAKTKSGQELDIEGNPILGAEPGTVEFYSGHIVTKGRVDNFLRNDQTKFTVVVWIEGNDFECVDDRIDGQLKLEMNMSVVH